MRPMLVLIAAYLLGSIPFGYLLVRAVAGADVRETGSGGTGATNVSRRAGKLAGGITLVLDPLKGALFLNRRFRNQRVGCGSGGAGHSWPLFPCVVGLSRRQGSGHGRGRVSGP